MYPADAAQPPERHVGNRIAIANEVADLTQALVQHRVMSRHFPGVPVDRIGDRLGRVVHEVNCLAREWRQAGRHQLQPGQHSGVFGTIFRREGTMFVGQIQQDRMGVEDGSIAVDDGRDLGVRG